MSNSIQTRTEMALLAVSVENLHGFCDSAWVNRESRQLWWSLHHFRGNGMLEIGSSQQGKFIWELQKQVQQEICPQDIKGCSTASLLIYLFHISSDLRWRKNENRAQKIRAG